MGADVTVALTANGSWSLPEQYVCPNVAEAAAEHVLNSSEAELRAEALLAEMQAGR